MGFMVVCVDLQLKEK